VVGAQSEKKPEPKKERETKDDGRYIIFYTFAYEEAGEPGLHSDGERAD
jgi:hypothetical protein